MKHVHVHVHVLTTLFPDNTKSVDDGRTLSND